MLDSDNYIINCLKQNITKQLRKIAEIGKLKVQHISPSNYDRYKYLNHSIKFRMFVKY